LSDEGRGSEVRDRWLRRGLATLWTYLFAVGGFAVASTWDRLVDGLVRVPIPTPTAAPAANALRTSPGETAVAQARRFLDSGNPSEALTALLAIKPEEPVYPFSLQLRDEALRALERAQSKAR
jgi:hypothetical protein